MKPDRKPDSKVFLIAQELELVRILAGNDPKARDKALKNLNKWFLRRLQTMPFKEEDFQKIWKGLFYCMWMSDKPLIQEECADRISKLVHFPDLNTSLSFFKAGLFILSNEWTGIDQFRLDKFLMLVRRLLREALRVLKNNSFKDKNIQLFNEALSDTILNKANNTPTGLFMHFNEIFMEELAKVTQGKIHTKSVVSFLQPFIQYLAKSDDGREVGHIRKFVFNYLINQSDVGLDYQERYEAWKQQGFPGSINSMQKVKVDKDEEMKETDEEDKQTSSEEKPLDPRAGRVDVEIPQIPFKARDIANALLEWKFDKNSSTLSRNAISVLSKQFKTLANGVYPLGMKKIDVKDKNEDISVRKAANRLIKFEQKLLGKERKRKRDKENNEKTAIEKKRAKMENEKEGQSTKKKKKTKQKKQNKDVINGESPIHVKHSKNKDTNEKDTDGKGKKKKSDESIASTLLDKNQIGSVMKGKDKRDKSKADTAVADAGSSKRKKSKNRSLTIVDNNKISTSIVKAKTKLKNKKDKTSNKKKKGSQIDNIECIFERNSGTWVVYEVEKTTAKQQSSNVDNDLTPVKTSTRGKNDFKESKVASKEKSSPSKSPNNSFMESTVVDSLPKAGLSPVKLFESPPEKKEVSPKDQWDEPLQEGEYEICIPSKRYIGKMKKQAKNKNKSVHELINTTLEKIKGKSRLSLDSRLANNPFLKPNSGKKVKINTKLNKSQEIYEHIRNVMSSPGIPYDATKKPSKPLLKPTAFSTPINPFYKKQLSIF